MGIGRLTDLAIAGLLDGAPMDPRAWAYERGKRMRAPTISPGGSDNHRPAARICDAISGHRDPSDPPEWRHPDDWLHAWYRLQSTSGHDGFELLSTTYGDFHTNAAMLCAHLGIPGARENLQRRLALYARHLHRGRLVMPGCRSKTTERPALAQWTLYMLGLPVPKHPKPDRPMRLAQRLRARRWVDPSPEALEAALATAVSAPGPLVWAAIDGGFASYFAQGPRCYAYPQPVVVARAGEVTFFRPPYTPKRGLPVGATTAELRCTVEDGDLVAKGGAWEQRVHIGRVVESWIPTGRAA